MKKIGDIEPGQSDVCHVIGLPILRKPEWTDIRCSENFQVTIGIIGDSIIWAQASGYGGLIGVRTSMELNDKVVAEKLPEGHSYVLIVDLSNVQGPSIKARKYYIDYMQNNGRLAGLVFFGVSPLMKMSIKLGKRLNIVKFDVQIVNDYSEAVKLALEIQSKEKTLEDKPVIAPSYEKNLSNEAFPSDEGSVCPVTSLPITTRPEWTDIPIDDNYSVSFRLIGKAILCTVLNGTLSETGSQKLLAERERILIEADLLDKKYAEIVDYSMYAGYPSKEIRMMFTNFLLKEVDAGNLLGLWVFNPPLFIKWMFNVGIKMYKKHIPASIVGDYNEAIEKAVNVLEKNGVDLGVRQYNRFTKDEWSFELENYGIRFELIGNDLVYTVAHGSLKEAYVAKFFDLHEKVLEEAGLAAKGYYYRIVNWENLEKTTWKARRMYIDGIKDLNKKVPCKLSVIFGLNKFMRTIVGFSKQFVPVHITTAHNLEEAMAIIEKEKKGKPGSGIVKNKKRMKKSVADEEIRNYSDELLRFMGAINWDQERTEWEDISHSHPFKLVFDAMAIIKEDVDGLFREHKQIEETLTREEEKYRTILENIEDGYFEIDFTGSLTFFNDALCRITGYPKNELVGINNSEYMDKETAKRMYKSFVQISQTGEPIKGLECAIQKSGNPKHVEASASLMKDGKGQPIGFRGILRDVSERKQTEQEIKRYSENLEEMVEERTEDLKKSEQKYRTILENIEDGYYEVDLAGNLTFFNDSAYRIIGYSKDELMGMNNREYTDEKNARKLYREFNKVYETGIPTKRLDWETVRKDGTIGFLESSISLITGSKGQPIGFRGILRDVTERKELEHEIIEKSRLAEEATRAKSEFLANMSHEIRTPLNGIIGMAELALDTKLDDNQKNIFHTINTEANSLQDVINEILDFSKIEAGKFDLEEIPFDLRVTIEDVANSFAHRA